jgi:hypothetical protein
VKTMVDRQRPATHSAATWAARCPPTASFPSSTMLTQRCRCRRPLPPRWRALPWVLVAILLLARSTSGAQPAGCHLRCS